MLLSFVLPDPSDSLKAGFESNFNIRNYQRSGLLVVDHFQIIVHYPPVHFGQG
jgi:hypothetical protein